MKLILLLLFTVYSSATLATWSGTSGWGETDWGSHEWGDKKWDKPDWGGNEWGGNEWGDKKWDELDWGSKEWGDKEWGDKEWDKCHASCDPKYDVSEPGIVGLLAIGLLGMVVARRRLNHK